MHPVHLDSSVGVFFLGREAPLQVYEWGEAEEWNGTEEKRFYFEGVSFSFFAFLCFFLFFAFLPPPPLSLLD